MDFHTMNKIFTKTALVLGAVLLVGCAKNTHMTLQGLDASLVNNEEASVRMYPGKSIADVRQAAHKVLYLLDPDDIVFDAQSDALLATRWSTFFAVFSATFGRDWYSVDLEQTDKGTIARFGFTGEQQTGIWISQIPISFKPKISISAYQNPADFQLFHDRVEYFLGLRDEWKTCSIAKSNQTNPENSLFLCDTLGLENKPPQEAEKLKNSAGKLDDRRH